MGSKFSVVSGVKSENFYEQGNAINEIWFGDVELLSRLPFGDSDLEQSGWPAGGWPKIPWHQFIIPLKRDPHAITNAIMFGNNSICCYAQQDKSLSCVPDVWSEKFGSYVFGILSTIGGIMMGHFAARILADASKEIIRRSKLRAQNARERFPTIVKRIFWIHAGFGGIIVLLGSALLFLGVPMAWYGLEQMTASFFFSSSVFVFVIITVGELLYRLVSLLMNLRRALAAARCPLNEELNQKDGAASITITVDKLEDRYPGPMPCPECEKRLAV
jgi:hypothetical protein